MCIVMVAFHLYTNLQLFKINKKEQSNDMQIHAFVVVVLIEGILQDLLTRSPQFSKNCNFDKILIHMYSPCKGVSWKGVEFSQNKCFFVLFCLIALLLLVLCSKNINSSITTGFLLQFILQNDYISNIVRTVMEAEFKSAQQIVTPLVGNYLKQVKNCHFALEVCFQTFQSIF